MKLAKFLLLGLSLSVSVVAQEAWGQQPQLWGQCNAISPPALPDSIINACTSLIESGQLGGRNLAIALVKRGWQYIYRKKDLNRGLTDVNQAIDTDPWFSDAWATRCSFLGGQHQQDRAIEDCNHAIAVNPADASGWAYRGDQFLTKGDLDRAISDYSEAIQRNPSWMWPLQDRGNAYQRKAQLNLALQDYNRVIQVAPNLAIGYASRANIYRSRGDVDAAIADYQKATQIEPGNTSFLTSLQQVQSTRQAEIDDYSRWLGVCFGQNAALNSDVAISACDQALNHRRASANDRSRLATRRADLQRQAADVKQHAEDAATFKRQWENCRNSMIPECDAAIQSSQINAGDRAQLISWRAELQKFEADVAACRQGSISACDIALGSVAASADDKQYLRDWRAAASPWAKSWAFLHSEGMYVIAVLNTIPASTQASSAVAALLAAVLLFVLIRQRRRRRAPDFAMDRSYGAAPRAATSVVTDNAPIIGVPSQGKDTRMEYNRQAVREALRNGRVQFDI